MIQLVQYTALDAQFISGKYTNFSDFSAWPG